jgi:hypothetical protein
MRSLSSHEIDDLHAGGDHGGFQQLSRGAGKRRKLERCRRLSANRAEDGTRFWVILASAISRASSSLFVPKLAPWPATLSTQ